MKTLMIALAPMIAMTAFATPVTNVTLSKSTNNGTVAPMFQHSTTCTIEGRNVTITNHGLVMVMPLTKAAVFNTDVPNETVMESLVNAAALGSVKNFPGPIGGGMTSYSADLNTAQSVLKQLSGGSVTEQNTSDAAAKLEKFIDSNCN